MDGFKRLPRYEQPNQRNTVPSRGSESSPAEPVNMNDQIPNPRPSGAYNTDMEQPPSQKPLRTNPPKRPWYRKKRFWVIGTALLVSALAAAIGYMWYQQQLQPVNSSDSAKQRFEVVSGEGFSAVVEKLSSRGLIKDPAAFKLYAQLSGKQQAIKAGTCSLSRSESASHILDKLTSGCHDFKSITFFPGATIEKPLYKSPSAVLDQTMYIKYVLKDAGYSDAEIAAALSKQYSSPLFAGKPANSTLEGYVYGETYYVDTDATAEEVLQETFSEMQKTVEKYNLVEKYKLHGLNLFQGITMASIVQRELNCEGKPTAERKERCYQYQRTIAQIFLKRLKEDISLGSDVTFIYAADMKGVTPTVDLDSPYNTRVHTGLPPGPIASPGELALRSVADPTDTDYVFFIAGDDGLIYFAKTQAEHEANIKNHCQQLCSEL